MSFASDLERFAKKAGVSLDRIVYQVTFEWFSSVVMASPVGNPDNWKNPERAPAGYVGGRFRGNWRTSVGTPETGKVEGIRPAQAVIGEIKSTVPSGAGYVVFLANNLPYGERLEYDGWSTQAPNGMVRVNMARIQNIVRKAVREHRV